MKRINQQNKKSDANKLKTLATLIRHITKPGEALALQNTHF
ncbi:hypothetical protein [Vagococcus salmoninarum]